MRRHLVLFVRAPRLGVGKRRLARDVGDLAALRFERAMLGLLERRLARDRRWRFRLAVSPGPRLPPPAAVAARRADRAAGRRRYRGPHASRPRLLPAGAGACWSAPIFRRSPRSHVAEAFRLLGRHDLVFGPAEDGGFWLVGARRSADAWPALFAGSALVRPASARRRAGQPAAAGVGRFCGASRGCRRRCGAASAAGPPWRLARAAIPTGRYIASAVGNPDIRVHLHRGTRGCGSFSW